MSETVVVVMAGGRSRRFGSNKALEPWAGRPLIEHVVEKAREAWPEVALSVAASEDFDWIALPRVADFERGAGPMGGLYSCMRALPFRRFLLVACDMPLLDPGFIRFLARLECSEPVVIPEAGGRLHPLHARYDRALFPLLRDLLREKRYRMSELFQEVPVRKIGPGDYPAADLELCLSNVNTVEEFRKLESRMNETG